MRGVVDETYRLPSRQVAPSSSRRVRDSGLLLHDMGGSNRPLLLSSEDLGRVKQPLYLEGCARAGTGHGRTAAAGAGGRWCRSGLN
jgi:hypothetical protein